MSDGFSPIRGKCTWWRERPVDEDVWDPRMKEGERRIDCSCFVEGRHWTYRSDEVPSDCEEWRHCRYHIKHL
jgi:hypothetical protein